MYPGRAIGTAPAAAFQGLPQTTATRSCVRLCSFRAINQSAPPGVSQLVSNQAGRGQIREFLLMIHTLGLILHSLIPVSISCNSPEVSGATSFSAGVSWLNGTMLGYVSRGSGPVECPFVYMRRESGPLTWLQCELPQPVWV